MVDDFLLVELYRATKESAGRGECWKFQDVHRDPEEGRAVCIELEEGLKKA